MRKSPCGDDLTTTNTDSQDKFTIKNADFSIAIKKNKGLFGDSGTKTQGTFCRSWVSAGRRTQCKHARSVDEIPPRGRRYEIRRCGVQSQPEAAR